ncbi:MAG: trimeric intracellular cation channel family protein [Methanobrevibacter sp.]|uniref:trimeric intracellular cation channel family protein n=1 Tax=Methanobrevibacter sp. TaxID=66852 RepID=UPI0026DEE5D7|nr:trimeric intracellular cation channel family protein [Methanobrevibacter sp.]MDO5848821.1 trimeric intracellular cation channel family protein [Methanobrevibacter sp.]
MNTYIFIFEVIGTIAFAISGALTGMRREMDIFGIAVLGITTAVGGGMVRDAILGITPVSALIRPEFILIAGATSLLIFPTLINKHIVLNKNLFEKIFLIADSIGLGIFTAYGFLVGFEAGFSEWFLLISVAVITGVGGGVMRDIFALQKPIIFVRHIYATASIAGAIVCYAVNLYFNINWAIVLCFIVVFILRILSAHLDLDLPKAKYYHEFNLK